MAILSLLGGNDGAERVDSNAPAGERLRDDAFNPKPAHEELLERVRAEAEAEALRHAEAIVNRIFPIVTMAESIGAQRVANLGAAYAAARSRLDADIAAGEAKVAAATNQIRTTEAALERQGVAAELLPLAPLGERTTTYWQAASAIAIGLAAGAVLARSDLTPAGIALVVGGAVALILALLSLRIARPEPAMVTSLRRTRRKEGEILEEHEAELQRNQALAKGLVEETLRLVEVERAFAQQLVATYESAASGALPVGALGDGERSIRKQRDPDVPIPPWVRDLEAEA